MIPNIVLTEDGSFTCADATSGELYHNRVGAFTEALKHYVEPCDLVERINKQGSITVLDVCFGLGYNSFVLLDYLINHIENGEIINGPIHCQIIGIDNNAEILQLIPEVLIDEKFARLCQYLHITKDIAQDMVKYWTNTGKYTLHFVGRINLTIQFNIIIEDVRKIIPSWATEGKNIDYIFHDGFSPRSMPELWTVDLFQQYTKLLTNDGRIITYSSAYAVRGALSECGLEVRKTCSLGGKSGGTIAFRQGQIEIVNDQTIFFLSDKEKIALKSRSRIPYRDPHLNNTAKQIAEHRQQEIRQF